MAGKSHRSAMLLIADDWSPIAGCYGNRVIRTPRIDEFARSGVAFDWAFCASPSCAVSRATILTGYHSHTHGQYGHCHGFHGFTTLPHMTSIPLGLGQKGFATACVGKKHVEPPSVYPFEYEPRVHARSPAGLADCARAFLRDNPGRPFYLHVGFSDPHRAGPGFANETRYRGVPEAKYDPNEVVVPPFLPDIPEVREDLADYYQAVSRLDSGVGMLLDVLEESGRADETLVIVTADHGMPFPGAKASFFEGGHHCPFIIRAPGPTRGGLHHRAMTNWTDIRPTIQDWCGVKAPPDLPGRSLLPILDSPATEGWDEVFFSHCFHEVIDYNPYRALRGRRYKLVRNIAPATPLPTDLFRSRTWTAVRERRIDRMGQRTTERVLKHEAEELYDLKADPTETTNRINDPDLHHVLRDMRERLLAFRRATGDPWLEVDYQEGLINRPGGPP